MSKRCLYAGAVLWSGVTAPLEFASGSVPKEFLEALFFRLSIRSASRSARFSFSASKPVFVSSCCLLRTFRLIQRLATTPRAAKETYRILKGMYQHMSSTTYNLTYHMVLKESAKAVRATSFWFSGSDWISPTLAPAAPPPNARALSGPRTAAS